MILCMVAAASAPAAVLSALERFSGFFIFDHTSDDQYDHKSQY